MRYFAIALFLLPAAYAAMLFILRRGLCRLKPGMSEVRPTVSVIIAARNEEKNIKPCLRTILDQSYPNTKLEIIVIDDRSEDQTAEIVNRLVSKHKQIRLLQIHDTSAHMAPKKRAIDLGIRHAKGEIIFTTDADCRPGRHWISEMIAHFEPDVGMVAGFNPYHFANSRPSLFGQILALDYFAMACVAAASAGVGYPISCTGGNLGYRKLLYRQLCGFKTIGQWVSGDDDFFLEQVRRKTDWKIRYSSNPLTFVPTAPPKTFTEFCHQRIRYASKGRHYKLPVAMGLTGIYLMNLLLIMGAVVSLFKPSILPFWVAGFLMKTLAEQRFLAKGQELFNLKFKCLVFVLATALHPIYIAFAGLLGQFMDFQWKGEKHSARITTRLSKPSN